MAAADANMISEGHSQCSICRDDPVSTPCGHNFCKNCITEYWNTNIQTQINCPMCKEVFNMRSQKMVNSLISEIFEQFRQKEELKTDIEVQQMIEERQVKIEEIKCSLKISHDDAKSKEAEGVEVFTALKESVDRGLDQFLKDMKDKQMAAEKQTEDAINELEKEISALANVRTELEKRAASEDRSIQSFLSLKDFPSIKDWTQVRVHPPSYEGSVVRAVAQIKEILEELLKKLKGVELKKIQQFAVDLTLDPDTAHPALILSEEGKQVHCGDVKKNLPHYPERFYPCIGVLGKQSFSSCRFYFEVQVKGKTSWGLGVARESINRKGNITLSPQDGFWTIMVINGNKYYALSYPPVRLFLPSPPEKVGVFVDCDEGLVSFYDIDTADLIYSFTGCSFSDKLHPFLSPCHYDGGKNSASLILGKAVNQ